MVIEFAPDELNNHPTAHTTEPWNEASDKPGVDYSDQKQGPGVLDGLMRTHGAMTKVTEALEAHKLHLLAEVDVIDAHARALMDLAQVERESKWEAIQASVAMVDRMLADLRGA